MPRTKRTSSAVALLSAAFLSLTPAALVAPVANAAANVTVKCQVVQISGGTVTGHVWGNGSNRTVATNDANNYVPRGHYKRHCYPQNHYRPSGYWGGGGAGGRF